MRNRIFSLRLVPLAIFFAMLAGCSSAPKQPVEEVKKSAVKEKAPDRFKVKLETSKGDVLIEVTKHWAPRGAERFFELVNDGYYDDARIFRVIPRFVAQFGINKDPKVNELWRELEIVDDPVKQSNKRGYLSFAKRGANTRTTQVFINLANNPSLDKDGFAPFGRVVEGMDVVDRFYKAYGEIQPRGGGPDPNKIQVIGNEYLERSFPRLDYIKAARVELDASPPANAR